MAQFRLAHTDKTGETGVAPCKKPFRMFATQPVRPLYSTLFEDTTVLRGVPRSNTG